MGRALFAHGRCELGRLSIPGTVFCATVSEMGLGDYLVTTLVFEDRLGGGWVANMTFPLPLVTNPCEGCRPDPWRRRIFPDAL